MTQYHYYHACIDWPAEDVHVPGGLSDLIDQRKTIRRGSFLRHVDSNELNQMAYSLGYAPNLDHGPTMASDRRIEYFQSTLHGKRVYGFVWSAIEYVFTQGD